MSDVTIQNVFEKFLPCVADRAFSDEQLNVIHCIERCRTPEMGIHVSECGSCKVKYIHYNSCKNRHCPMCQGMEIDEWVDLRREDVLDAPYFHAVFSIPSQLNALVYNNQKLLYDALYHSVSSALKELSVDPKHLGAQIGFICVLHTWGSDLKYHPHIHTIILGGGLDTCNHWRDAGHKYLFPVKVMSKVFRKYYLIELKNLRASGKLKYTGTASRYRNSYVFKALLDELYEKDWVVYNKETFKGAHEVFKYLGKYTHRIAISNRRILSVNDDNVKFMAKDYKADGKYKPMTLPGENFVLRFMMHVLPKGFVRIRYYGILSCRCKNEKLTMCRKLLGCQKYQSLLRGKTAVDKIRILYNRDITRCSRCGEPLISYVVPGRYMLC